MPPRLEGPQCSSRWARTRPRSSCTPPLSLSGLALGYLACDNLRKDGLPAADHLFLAALAEAGGIGLASIKDYVGNRRRPSLEIAKALAKITGVSCQVFDGVEFRHASQRIEDQPGVKSAEEEMPKKPGRPRKAEAPAVEEPKKKPRKKKGE